MTSHGLQWLGRSCSSASDHKCRKALKRPEVPSVLQDLKDLSLLSSGIEHQIVLGLSHPGFLTL